VPELFRTFVWLKNRQTVEKLDAVLGSEPIGWAWLGLALFY
jgi:hypothetical protein